MICPNCGQVYERRDFGRDESYFECETCNIQLLLSSQEKLDELVHHGRGLDDTPSDAGSTPYAAPVVVPETRDRPATWPIKLWVGLMIFFLVFGIILGVGELTTGHFGSGVFVAVLYVVLFVPTILGVLLRRRFGLYLTYALLGLFLIGIPNTVFHGGYRSGAELVGTLIGAGVFGTLAVLGLIWFSRNSHLFPARQASPTLVDDIYTAPKSDSDV